MDISPCHRASPRRPPRANARGFTLVELMISVTIGLAIIASLVGVLAASSSSSKTNDRTSELQFNAHYALNALKHELLQAGYRGYTWAEPNTVSTSVGTVPGECGDGTGLFVRNIRQGVWGADESNPFAANCVPDKAGADGGDVLVLRRLDGTPVAAPQSGTFYFRSTYSAGEVFRGPTPPASISGVTPLADFQLHVYVYYVRPFTVSESENPQVPALMRVALQSNGAMVRELVASGIEQFQIQYGRRTTALETQYFDEFTVANCPSCALATPTTSIASVWDEVDAVRIWILARSATPEPGYRNNESYSMGNQVYTVNDGFRRRLFSTIVQLRN